MKDERELNFGRPGALHSALLGRLPAHRRGRRSSAPICTVGAEAIPSTDPSLWEPGTGNREPGTSEPLNPLTEER